MGAKEQAYEFANFRLLPDTHTLLRDGEQVPLRPKLFELLLFLVEHHGQLLEKDEINKEVWGEANHGDPQYPLANLNVNVSNLRQVLGDDSEHPLFIETIPRRGYRFIAPVNVIIGSAIQSEEMEKEDLALSNSPEDPEAGKTQKGLPPETASVSRETKTWKTWKLISLGVLLLILLALIPWAAIRSRANRENASVDRTTMNSEALPIPGELVGQTDSHSGPVNKKNLQVQIFSMDPASPLAWVGDKPIRIAGEGFQIGQSVTMVFPNGGSGTLSGSQLRDLSPNSFLLLAAFNNNAGDYRIRVNLPDGTQSDWFYFRVTPMNLWPQVETIKQVEPREGFQRIQVTGYNFQQGLSVRLEHPTGKVEELPARLVFRTSDTSFDVAVDSRGHKGPFKLQARNPNGKNSNIGIFQLNIP